MLTGFAGGSDEAGGGCQTAAHRPAEFLLTINYCRRIVCMEPGQVRLESTRSIKVRLLCAARIDHR
jgi:hypothetical protein